MSPHDFCYTFFAINADKVMSTAPRAITELGALTNHVNRRMFVCQARGKKTSICRFDNT